MTKHRGLVTVALIEHTCLLDLLKDAIVFSRDVMPPKTLDLAGFQSQLTVYVSGHDCSCGHKLLSVF